MPYGQKRDFARVLIVLAVILIGAFIAFDLTRPDSLLRSWFGFQPSPRSQTQDLIDALRRSR